MHPNNIRQSKAVFLVLVYLFTNLLPVIAKPDQDPYFVKMKGFAIKSFNTKKIEIESTAVFYNTYKAKAKLEEVYIEVYLEDDKLGVITQSETIDIPKESAFDIPLLLKLEPPGPAIKSSLWQSGRFLFGKEVKIKYKGYIKMKAIGFIPFKVKVEDSMPVSMSDLF